MATDVLFEVSQGAIDAGVRVMNLGDALASDAGPVVVEHLGAIAGSDDPFLAFSLAVLSGGAVVMVPGGARAPDPIRIRHVLGDIPEGRIATPRTFMLLGPGASAEVIEELDVASGYAIAVSEAVLAEGSSLSHARFESTGRQGRLFSHDAVRVGRDASVTHVHAMQPAGILKTEAVSTLAGPGAHAEGLAVSLVGGRGRGDYRVREVHASGDTTSRVIFRSIVVGRGRSVFTGLLRIEEGAARSEAFEEARSLLLSKSASAEAIPELEILNHDVRCSHGAATGPMDEDAVHYLRTRGLTRLEAESLLVEGFVAPVLSRLPSREFADEFRARLVAELAAAREQAREAIGTGEESLASAPTG
jgi:Fe-S cluster assembly protein SufD